MTPRGHGPSLSQAGGMAGGGGEPPSAHPPIPSAGGQGCGEHPRCTSAYSWAFLLVLLGLSVLPSRDVVWKGWGSLEGVLGSVGHSWLLCLGFWSFCEPGVVGMSRPSFCGSSAHLLWTSGS